MSKYMRAKDVWDSLISGDGFLQMIEIRKEPVLNLFVGKKANVLALYDSECFSVNSQKVESVVYASDHIYCLIGGVAHQTRFVIFCVDYAKKVTILQVSKRSYASFIKTIFKTKELERFYFEGKQDSQIVH